jgi:outer membrane receptor protein involved in Fe transport
LLFDPLNFEPSLRQTSDTDSARLGLRHDLGARSTLLASVLYAKADFTAILDPDIEILSAFEGITAELQHIYAGDGWNLTSGIRNLNLDNDETATLPVFVPFPPFVMIDTTMQSFESKELTVYLYSNYSLTRHLQMTLGLSATASEGRAFDEDQINPKFGMVWQPADSTTVRLAAFRTLQANYISDSNIQPFLEPTEVAGFNQFFNGVEGEDAWRYGAAIDQRVGERFWTGVEYSRRDVETPIIFLGPPDEVFIFDTKEESGRLYFYWTPFAESNLSLRAEYQYEKKDTGDNPAADTSTQLRTHRAPMSVNYFARNGLSASLTGTYVDQKGSFVEFLPFPPFVDTVNRRDNFWVFDASIGYRLPKRYGQLTLSAKNLTDETFRFQDVDPTNPRILPDRLVLLRFTVDFSL